MVHLLSDRRRAPVACLVLLAAAAGCAAPAPRPAPEAQPARADWRLAAVTAHLPEDIAVDENPDTRFPVPGSLVWHGEPKGDRKLQIRALIAAAARDGAVWLSGARPVEISVDISRFRAITPRTRAIRLPVGRHDIAFDIAVRDAETGALLAEERGVKAGLPALSGPEADVAASLGQTQKARIRAHVANVVRDWLAGREG